MRISRRQWLSGGLAASSLGLGGSYCVREKRKLDGKYDFASLRPPDGAEAWVRSMGELERDAAAANASVVHVGQSTHLLSLGGKRFLTDPWFYDPSFGALSHRVGPAVAPEGVGKLDFVLITHDHPDHADPKALDQLDKGAVAVVAVKEHVALMKKLGYRLVVLLEPWQSFPAADGVEIAAVPAVHDVYEIGFVVKAGGRSVYFAGDTKLHKDLPEIAARFAPDTAILPVDGTKRVGNKTPWVMTPQDAVQAAQILKVKTVMPSHADTFISDALVRSFHLATFVDDAKPLFEKLLARQLPAVKCVNPAPGERAPL